ncbi:PAS domain-containing protein [Hymenobacter sp. J193]|uniref:PAS domain-containing protein n=1 Tax=Hymenobacter sp. J193 TaxID=2898429 RepID=UPI002150FE3A|nr:PAS domain-containing protein [Hymenobacter sp. J193]MCR5886552.1 PAS domain-containing protein [Hymenobacter sp. J193]
MATRPTSPALAASPTAQEPLYQALFDGAYDAILLYDEQATLVDCNRTALTLLGTTRPVLLSSGLTGFMADHNEAAENGWASPEQLRLAILAAAQTGQQAARSWRGHRADHTSLTARATLHRIELPTGLRVQLTLRREEAEALSASPTQPAELLEQGRAQLRDLLSRSGLSYVLVDLEARVVDVNEYFLEYTEYRREEVLNYCYYDLFLCPGSGHCGASPLISASVRGGCRTTTSGLFPPNRGSSEWCSGTPSLPTMPPARLPASFW